MLYSVLVYTVQEGANNQVKVQRKTGNQTLYSKEECLEVIDLNQYCTESFWKMYSHLQDREREWGKRSWVIYMVEEILERGWREEYSITDFYSRE